MQGLWGSDMMPWLEEIFFCSVYHYFSLLSFFFLWFTPSGHFYLFIFIYNFWHLETKRSFFLFVLSRFTPWG
jgi:hypothetical protein